MQLYNKIEQTIQIVVETFELEWIFFASRLLQIRKKRRMTMKFDGIRIEIMSNGKWHFEIF
jgi:hypothetical protein